MPGDTAERETPFQRTTKVAGTSGRLRSGAGAHFGPDPRGTALSTMALEKSDDRLPHGGLLLDDRGHVLVPESEFVANRRADVC